ncbi:Inorganic pyrophosphatase [Astathelohania contejeani]|uniref:inorganic diphosphatase n=1 Tax=Astathelohania contejeani TaxID=164912 RepID=A0ABQ7HYQ3_9MICR|nr:Inorganic pyrophosphatase [Thelohania contejeani]
MENYLIKEVGSKYSSRYRVYISYIHDLISPFHDIPLYHNVSSPYITVINEIPRFENAEFKIQCGEGLNPIKQEEYDGEPLFVPNIFPTKGYPWNQGKIPQTWEDPNKKDDDTNKCGDNEPLDVIEIGTRRKNIGEVYVAKVIGCIGLLKDHICDWKIIVIDINDPMAKLINEPKDINEAHLEFIGQWLKNYKVSDGKKRNKLAFDGKCMDKEFTYNIIQKSHEKWKYLMMNDDIGNDISKFRQCDIGLKIKDMGVKLSDSTPNISLSGFKYVYP